MFESREKPEQKDEVRLTPGNKMRLIEFGLGAILEDPNFGVICLRAGGLSEQDVQRFLGVAKSLQQESAEKMAEKIKQDHKKMEKLKLDPRLKLLLKDMGLNCVAEQQFTNAKNYFERAGVSDKEIRPLLDLDLVGIDAEKKKIQEELARMSKE